LHEFYFSNPEEATASSAFVTGLLSSRMRTSGAVLWISTAQKIFPPALKAFGVNPHQVIFLQLKREKELAWAVEEALKCKALAAVVSELPTLSFTESRRFQLAIEQSGVSCFVLRRKPANPATTAVTRWQVKPKNSRTEEGLPGVGHPSWNVALLKVRNGKPGIWDIEWVNGTFRQVSKLSILQQTLQKKTG
jgi:protein ImuA